jgi:hypothetical protein
MRDAKKNMVTVKLHNGTIPHGVEAKYASSTVLLMRAPGKGIVAGSAVRTVLELAGVKEVSAKILSRSKNKLNIARAAVKVFEIERDFLEGCPFREADSPYDERYAEDKEKDRNRFFETWQNSEGIRVSDDGVSPGLFLEDDIGYTEEEKGKRNEERGAVSDGEEIFEEFRFGPDSREEKEGDENSGAEDTEKEKDVVSDPFRECFRLMDSPKERIGEDKEREKGHEESGRVFGKKGKAEKGSCEEDILLFTELEQNKEAEKGGRTERPEQCIRIHYLCDADEYR